MNIAPPISMPEALGYTEAEARFLYIVATHSGYFVARQFLAFNRSPLGKRTTLLLEQTSNKRHARTECFPKSGTVYHLFSGVFTARSTARTFAPPRTRNRNIQRRIAMLDFVLLNQG